MGVRHLIAKRNQTVLLVLCALIGLPAMLGADGGCTLTPQVPNTSATPGDNFASAGLLTFDSNGSVSISGNITGTNIDFYDLGAVSPGDRIIIRLGDRGTRRSGAGAGAAVRRPHSAAAARFAQARLPGRRVTG